MHCYRFTTLFWAETSIRAAGWPAHIKTVILLDTALMF